METKKYKKWISLFLFLGLSFSIEIISGLMTRTSLDSWYLTLKKPFFNPPSWLFGPTWTLLYGTIGICGWLVYQLNESKKRNAALGIYGLQLLFNLLWSFFFFFLQSPFLALLDICILVYLIIYTTIKFWFLSRTAALVFFPYLIWTIFATTLNVAIVLMN